MGENSELKVSFDRVAIIGVGLIGGSLGLVLRERGIAGSIVGIGRGLDNLKTAKSAGIIDEYTQDIGRGVEGADLIIVATPVGAIMDVIEGIIHRIKKGAVIMDVGSVKGDIVSEVEKRFGDDLNFVGAHPIAGTEDSGAGAAFSTLFKNRKCIITPTSRTDKDSLEKVKTIWEEAGSDVVFMDTERHDLVCAAISHLPHLIAYTLVNTVGDIKGEDVLKYSAGGFKDFTRIASSPPEMWRDICIMNKKYILEMIGLYEKRLENVRELIENGNAEALMEEFKRAKGIKEDIEN